MDGARIQKDSVKMELDLGLARSNSSHRVRTDDWGRHRQIPIAAGIRQRCCPELSRRDRCHITQDVKGNPSLSGGAGLRQRQRHRNGRYQPCPADSGDPGKATLGWCGQSQKSCLATFALCDCVTSGFAGPAPWRRLLRGEIFRLIRASFMTFLQQTVIVISL